MRSLLLAFATVAVAGCATLFATKTANVAMSSNPPGAEILSHGDVAGRTPLTLELAKNREYVITFRMQGHEDATCRITRTVGAGWVILDILGGLLPVVIDAATGSWYGLNSTACAVNLRQAVGG